LRKNITIYPINRKVRSNVLAKSGRDESVSMDSMAKICKILECDVGAVMEFVIDSKVVEE
jgi:DNA (cytosine-5)-methyltransferase 1